MDQLAKSGRYIYAVVPGPGAQVYAFKGMEGKPVYTITKGKVEMGLRVAWDVPNIFEYFVNTHPELRAARDRFLGRNHVPTQEDKIEVGRLFDRVLQEDREEHTERVEEILSPCCFEIRRNPTRSEKEIMSLACLVGREAADKDFEAAIFEAARGFDNNFSFDFNGPWAPHNFVDVELRS